MSIENTIHSIARLVGGETLEAQTRGEVSKAKWDAYGRGASVAVNHVASGDFLNAESKPLTAKLKAVENNAKMQAGIAIASVIGASIFSLLLSSGR